MDLNLEKEVEQKYTQLLKKAAIAAIIIFVIIAILLVLYYETGDTGTGYSLKCFQNHTECTDEGCQNVTPTSDEIEDCLRGE